MVGWCAHWRESLTDPDTKIIRPQQDYRGVWLRDYTPIDSRTSRAAVDSPGTGDSSVVMDTPAPLPPSNAYRRRVAGTGWQ
jgi:citrate synthase